MRQIGKRIGKWNTLPASGKLAFLKAAICLTLIKAGLTFLPFGSFRKVFQWFTNSDTTQEFSRQQIDLIVWAVDTAANLLPFELLCLPRALATKFLLRKAPALTLEIGVEVNPAKQFEAHAWVEKNGKIIIGEWPKTITYQRLWVWQ